MSTRRCSAPRSLGSDLRVREEFSYDRIRPKGARIKTKGGRASGPEPLKRVLDFARQTIFDAEGRSLLPIEVHDIMCMIAEIVISARVLSEREDPFDLSTGEARRPQPSRRQGRSGRVR